MDNLYKEIEEVIKVYQLLNIQQHNNEHSSDMDSDTHMDLTQENKDKFMDTQENSQEQTLQADNIETLAEGTKPMLLTLHSTPGARNSSSSTGLTKDRAMSKN